MGFLFYFSKQVDFSPCSLKSGRKVIKFQPLHTVQNIQTGNSETKVGSLDPWGFMEVRSSSKLRPPPETPAAWVKPQPLLCAPKEPCGSSTRKAQRWAHAGRTFRSRTPAHSQHLTNIRPSLILVSQPVRSVCWSSSWSVTALTWSLKLMVL